MPPASINSTADTLTKQQQQQQQHQRLHYIDWLRAFIIALVILFHCYDLYFNYTYSAGVYLGIVNTPPADGTRTAAIVLAQLIQVGRHLRNTAILCCWLLYDLLRQQFIVDACLSGFICCLLHCKTVLLLHGGTLACLRIPWPFYVLS
jgi:hypothetical protein